MTRSCGSASKRSLLLTLPALAIGLDATLLGWDPPTAAGFRSAFEAQYPKTDANAEALELERLGAQIGIDLVPNTRVDAPPEDMEPEKGDQPFNRWVKIGGDRAIPTREAAAAFRPVAGAAGQFIDRELKRPEETIGPPPPALERFLSDNQSVLDAMESVLLGKNPVVWDLDVETLGGGPFPSVMGVLQLQRLLVSRALFQARRGGTEGALQTLDAGWKLNETLASRPELLSHIIVVGMAKLQVGALRKVDSPAWGWSDRLRSGDLFHAFLAAFQNEFWLFSEASDLTGQAGARGRVLRQVAEEFRDRDLCEWTPTLLEEMWESAMRDQVETEGDQVIAEIQGPNLIQMLARWRRFAIDAELTALVLDARAERAASPRRLWPPKMHTLGNGVCPRERWTYRVTGPTATFAFEGKLEEAEGPAFRLPFRFTAGLSAAPVRRSPTPGPRRRTTPEGDRASPGP